MRSYSGNGADVEDGRAVAASDSVTSTPSETNKGKTNDYYARFYKLIFCFAGLQISYLMWGVVQEHIMTHEYKLGKFKSSAFLVFANRFLALIISLIIVAVQKMMNPKKSPLKEVPFYYYAPSSLSNTVSSWAQYEALKYVSFPTQVLSKSCKIIPVMLVGLTFHLQMST